MKVVVLLLLCSLGLPGVDAVVANHVVRRDRSYDAEALVVNSAGMLATSVHRQESSPEASCTPLTNHGSYFSAEIMVGHNKKKFNVVADTGSNSVIVTSCMCVSLGGGCTADDNCLSDADSSTLYVNQSSDGKVPVVVMAFGSGQIEAEVASDTVSVGSIEANMTDQLLLMVARRLELNGTFEGILGLGIPESTGADWTGKHGVHHKDNSSSKYAVRSFLQVAHVSRFALCFQDSGGGESGALHLNTPALSNPLGSVGVAHWGLDFRGISVGTESTPAEVSFCKDVVPGQTTPCGAIPDSGTTLLMGPKDHLEKLFVDICDRWPRCTTEASQNSITSELEKAELAQLILANCSTWLDSTDANGLDELPELHFYLNGKETGQSTTLTFKGHDYIEMGVADASGTSDLAYRTTLSEEPLNDYLNRRMPTELLTSPVICVAAFGAMDYKTAENGPVWILGTPLFYAFEVSYDLNQPPSMQISNTSCQSCSDSFAEEPRGLFTKLIAEEPRRPRREPRRILGKVRGPSQPLSGPL